MTGWARARSIWATAQRTLDRHADAWLTREQLRASLVEFGLHQLPEAERGRWAPLALSWQRHDWLPVGQEQTISQRWLSTESELLVRDPCVAEVVRSASSQSLSFFQARALDRGRGILVRNVLTDEERFVVDVHLSAVLSVRAIVVGRLVEFNGITMFDAIGPRALGSGWAREIRSAAKDDLDLKLPATHAQLGELATELVHLYRDWSA